MRYMVPLYDFVGQRLLITGDPGTGKSLTAYCIARDMQRDNPELPLLTNLNCTWPGPMEQLRSIKELLTCVYDHGTFDTGVAIIWEELQNHCSTLAPNSPNVQMLYSLLTEIRKWRLNFMATAVEEERVSGVIRGLISLRGKPHYHKEADHIALPTHDKYGRPQKTMHIQRPSSMHPFYDTHQKQSQVIGAR